MGKEQQMIEYMVQDLVEMLTESQGIEFDERSIRRKAEPFGKFP